MLRKRVPAVLVVSMALLFPVSVPASVDVREVTSELVCTCGCGNMIVANCSCSEAERVRSEVVALSAQGLSRDAILARFAERYGAQVLAAPPARGFGLAAWILPFAAVAAALWWVSSRLHRWASVAEPPLPLDEQPVEKSDHYSSLLDREIKDA